MKIAYLFYGYARTHGQLINNYKTFLDCNNDVFIETYDTFYSIKDIDDINYTDIVTYTSEEYFRQTFSNIKYCNISRQNNVLLNQIIINNKLPKHNQIGQLVIRTLSMFTTIQKLINAKIKYEKLHNFKYDCCVILRLDLLFNSKLIIPSNLNKLSYPHFYSFNEHNKIEGTAKVFGTDKCLNDQIMICNSDICNKLKDIINMIPFYYHKRNIMINNETLIGYQLIFNNIDFSKEDFVTYKILR